MKKRTYGTGSFRQLPSGKYQLRYHGKTKVVEAKNDKAADRELDRFVDELDREERDGPAVSMNKLFDLHLADLRRMKRDSLAITQQRLEKHLRAIFGDRDATAISRRDITAYVDARLQAGAANATVNRELAIVRRAFKIGIEEEYIFKMPKVTNLPEDNARQGFVEEDVYRTMLRELPQHVQAPWVFSYFTGIRKGELLSLLWDWVDWDRWVIEVPGSITKNKKKRIIPVYSDMRQFLRLAFENRNPACPYIFQKDGARLRSFRTAFDNARERVNLPALLFHDLRRTAVRNMERAGIPRTMGRQVSGHLTEAVYIRYAIGAERDAVEVGDKMRAFHEQERARQSAEWEKLWHELWHDDSGDKRQGSPQGGPKYKQ